MYAIIRDGGRQYKVEEGQELNLDLRESSTGDKIALSDVLAIGSDDGLKLGAPVLEGASVEVEVLGVEQGEKLTVQYFRRRKNSRRRNGHRQMFTRVRVNKIANNG